MNVAYFFYCKIDCQMFVIHLNHPPLKTLFLQILVIKMIFLMKLGCIDYFLLYMWVKYEPIWTNFTAKTVTLVANLLVKAQTIPQNAKCALFFQPKVAFTKDI